MSNWYSNERDGWYQPLQPPVNGSEAKDKKKSRDRLKAVAAIAAVVLLIVLSAKLFPNRNAAQNAPQTTDNPAGDGGFGNFINPGGDDSMPDDRDDFFSSFYTNTDTERTVINIERAELPIKFECSVDAAGDELTLQELYKRCADSIVAISGYTDGKAGYNWGTGVILSGDGLVLTNTHVIADCDRATVTLGDDSVYEAKLVGADSISDVAVLKIDATGLSAASFGDSSVLEVGDRVAAIGNPLGEEFRLTLTDGIISAIERGMNYKGHSMNLLQTNTAINEGNSGGPLFNMYGQVVGITNMKMMSSYSSIEGIGFAIPSQTVVKIVNLIVKEGAVNGRPSIGITVGAIPDTAKEYYNLPSGLYISAVAEGSDAAAKGIKPGDILLKVNGEEVSETAQVAAIKEGLSVGDTMTLTVWRSGETFDVVIVLVDTNDVYG